MKIGDYVRTEVNDYKQCVTIISKIEYFSYNNLISIEDSELLVDKESIIKSSPNIKSVIEKDDFINGKRVNRVIPEDICGDELLDYQHIFVDDKEIYEEDIKTIVTHEQFESMEYKVGE